MSCESIEDEPRVTATKAIEPLTEKSTANGRARWQFLYTVGVAFAIVALQMAQGILLARLLGPEGRGQYATAVLYFQLLLYVGLFGGLEVICRYAAADEADTSKLRRSALWLGLTTGTATTIVCVALCLIAIPTEKRFLIPMALLCSLSLIGQQVMLMMTAVDRGSGQFAAYNVRRLIAAAAFPAMLLIAALVVQVDLWTTCVLFLASSLISMGASLYGLKRPWKGPIALPVPQLLRESRPYALSMFVTDLFERLDLVLVLWLASLVDQGFYAAMVPVAYPLSVIPNTLGIFLFNAGANRNRQLTRIDVHRILGSAFAVQTLTTIIFVFLIGPVVRFLYSEAFAPAIIFALWLAPVFAIRGVLQGLDAYLKGRGRPLAPIRARLFSAVVMIAVTASLIGSQGAVAIAIGALAGQVVCVVWLAAIVYADVWDTPLQTGGNG